MASSTKRACGLLRLGSKALNLCALKALLFQYSFGKLFVPQSVSQLATSWF